MMKYLETHPWLIFDIDLRRAPTSFWIMLGECQSKCEHLAGVPLAPAFKEYLHRVYLAKGVAATTAIEGNTLSENQVLQQIEGKLDVPPSQEYLKQEVENIIFGCNLILNEIQKTTRPAISVERIKELNKIVLRNLQLGDQETIPGEIRHHSVGVGTYRGAPPEDCEYLLKKLCEWINGETFTPKPGMEIIYAILKAIVTHVYIAWIHPFGDGNGRTARLLEVQILLCSGVPSPAAQLLSNHYNATRSEYYRHLDVSRKDVLDFLLYAVQGFTDALREQVNTLRVQQWEIAWLNHVHKVFAELKGTRNDRRKHLVLDLSNQLEPVPFPKLREISPRVAVEYTDRTWRTLRRDLWELARMNLIARDEKTGGWRAKKETILAFLPPRAQTI